MDLVANRSPLAAVSKDESLPYWERVILARSIRFIRKQQRTRQPKIRERVKSLARLLDLMRSEARGFNARRFENGQESFTGNRRQLDLLLEALGSPDELNEWNRWRRLNQQVKPDLRGANLAQLELRYVRLDHCDLRHANLSGGSVRQSRLDGSDLRHGVLRHVDANYSSFVDADLRNAVCDSSQFTGADFRGCNLRGAKLLGCSLNQIRVGGAKFRGALVWGSGVWNVRRDRDLPTEEQGLRIGWENLDPIDVLTDPRWRPPGVEFKANRLEVAHFLALVRDAPSELSHIIDAASQNLVLILGRFRGPQYQVLKRLRDALPKHGLAPVVFDFDPPEGRDLSETVSLLAGLAHFVIADLSRPSSTPLEVQLIVPNIAVPFVPIIRASERPFAMFAGLERKYPWVLSPVRYRSPEALLRNLEQEIIVPARQRARWLRAGKRGEARRGR
jgi:uncharacterized protein YjbI with pentapeptide repeats